MLKNFFNPSSVALIGASTTVGKIGYDVLKNLHDSGFSGKIYPVNPKHQEILGYTTYSHVTNIPEPVDLAIIVIPASSVVEVLEECGKKGVKNIIIISAGFKEIGAVGEARERDIKTVGKKYNLRILGPNCLGYINTLLPINASFAQAAPRHGNIAFFSQSGALGTAVIDMARARRLGFAYFVSIGNKVDISEMDLLRYWATDPAIKVILAYIENIEQGQEFIKVARTVTKEKPVIVLKAGKTEKGQRAVSSHTGALAGSTQAYSAAFTQSGVIEVDGVQDLFDFAEAFSYQPLPAHNRVAVITNAGGPGILITDLLPDNQLILADFSEQTKEALQSYLPPAASCINPVDILGDARADRYAYALAQVLNDPNVDAVIVVLTPQKMTEIEATTEQIGVLSKKTAKPIILCFLGEQEIEKHFLLYQKYALPLYEFPDQAVRVLSKMLLYQIWQSAPCVSEQKSVNQKSLHHQEIGKILHKSQLTEVDCRHVLDLYGCTTNDMFFVLDKSHASKTAENLQYPLALKVVSPQVVHKSEVGGVKVNIPNHQVLLHSIDLIQSTIASRLPEATIDGYLIGQMTTGIQVIMGMKRDPQFGAVLMFGLGGIYAEVFHDVVFRIAPIDYEEALNMIQETKVFTLLKGVRGEEPTDIEAVVNMLVQLSRFSLEFPQIQEIDFNPVMVHRSGEGCEIVDVRMLF